MIEETLINYLSSALSLSVYAEEPHKPPGEYLIVEKIGSSSENYIESATIAIQSYSKTLYDVAKLNECVKSAMSDIVALPNISSCKLNSDYNFTDTETKRYRYQAVYDIVYY